MFYAAQHECESCTAFFWSEEDSHDHMDDYSHWGCQTCSRSFGSQRAANQHMSATDHWARLYDCEVCTLSFSSQAAADGHMRASSHYEHYCTPCGIRFSTDNNLRMHLNSHVHRGRTMKCPFCVTAHFTTASGLAHHLETGSCPRAPQLNREAIYKAIRKHDTNGALTLKQLGWHDEQDATTYQATDRAFNGYSWECYMCHRCFKSSTALNQHLNSPVHKQKLYRCPNLKVRCGKEFVSLAAFFNHLESESCGYTRFENVQRSAYDVISGPKLLAF